MATIRKRTWKSKGAERSAWVVDYFDQARKRRLKTFSTRKEADAWAVQARHEVQQGTHSPASTSLTVAAAWQLWIDHCVAAGLERSTIRQRQQHLRLHVEPFIGRAKLSSLTMPHIHRFNDDLRTGGRSPAMRRKVLTNLKTALSFAQGRGLVSQNVARGVRLQTSDRDTPQLKEGRDFPSRPQLKTLIQAAAGRWRPLLITAVFTGMRASELRGLAWTDVDLEAGVISVRQRADAWGTLGPPKSKAGKRDIPLTPMVVNALRQWQAECPHGELGLVFPNGAGHVESLQNIWRQFWVPLQLACGMCRDTGKVDAAGEPIMSPRYGFHMLRHAAASLFIAYLGWTPKRVQTVMGHASITMTFDRYGHMFEDRDGDAEAMKKLEAAVVAA